MPEPERIGIMAAWWRTMRRVSYRDAQRASDTLWNQGGAPYGDHPVRLKQIIEQDRERHQPAPDMGVSWDDATDEDKAVARGVIADVIKSIGRPEPTAAAEPPEAHHRNYPATVEEARAMLKESAIGSYRIKESAIGSYRIETINQYAERMKRSRRRGEKGR
jgi:hypothetical protein